MGKTKTPAHRIEYTLNRVPQSQAWPPEAGIVTETNLRKWREGMNKSLVKGGANFHLSEAAGVLLQVGDAKAIEQKSGTVLATVKQPMFEVIPAN